jgi:ATP-dependent protease ClpP protease subunit
MPYLSEEEDIDGSIDVSTQERKILRKSRKVCLMDYIDIRSSRRMVEDMEILANESLEPITVLISSSGGGVSSGMACVQAIRKAQSKGIKVTGEVYGHAMSMAFLILQCCDKRMMGELCTLMAHGVTAFTVGDTKNITAEKKLLEYWQLEFSKLIADRVTQRANTPKIYSDYTYWMKIFADNCPQFYSSKEAYEMGLIDEVK